MASTSPERMARRVSSASLRRATNSRRERTGSFCGERFFFLSANLFPPSASYYFRIQVQSEEHFFKVRQVANDPSQREREQFNERGHRHNLLVPGQIRLLVNVDDFQVIPILQVLLTNPLDILYSQRRFQGGSAYVQTQDVLFLARIGAGLFQFPVQSGFPLSCRAALFREYFHVFLAEWVSLPFADPGPPTAAQCWTGLQ